MIGSLRHQITIQSETRTANGSGGWTATWSTFRTPWASIEPKSGLKRFFADQLGEVISHVIKVRYQPGITTAMRIVYGTRIFQIHSAMNVQERNRWLLLLCKEGDAS